jgi:hypothetical protein
MHQAMNVIRHYNIAVNFVAVIFARVIKPFENQPAIFFANENIFPAVYCEGDEINFIGDECFFSDCHITALYHF